MLVLSLMCVRASETSIELQFRELLYCTLADLGVSILNIFSASPMVSQTQMYDPTRFDRLIQSLYPENLIVNVVFGCGFEFHGGVFGFCSIFWLNIYSCYIKYRV